ncbi:MAG: 2-amino-4-hydroxy-6-hydroxymethyldihydropteridine diphosphokinase [Saprospiraceae bacterium]|nr:MAG: 2-amino-4-hydroxy-6- hydroxymethyldihydropteridine pyrophosphokinase [Bacteroidetes bacterium OLB9]MCO6463287.1 2-amino-4-hydroxy-6-hydroxymethyldihydropteridine diphosphokinase [Saprospiraceae bacterium]MCZ2336945.1 2-amino-4-hydroxy-6-hydroxymethyldihydropteridine diphosphokinase [Chitinophagales bacterium]
MHTYYFLLGSNVGNRKENLTKAIDVIHKEIGTVIARSSVYETEPWGLKDQPDFYNMAIEVHSAMDPEKVFVKVKEIEQLLERENNIKWGPRSIDVDILYCDQIVMKKDHLQIPHPQIYNRNFVLIPLMEIAGDYTDPVKKHTIEEIYDACEDECEVFMLDD